jgi:hypothetical protein
MIIRGQFMTIHVENTSEKYKIKYYFVKNDFIPIFEASLTSNYQPTKIITL